MGGGYKSEDSLIIKIYTIIIKTDDWMNFIEPIAANVPYMVIPGNHDYHFNFSHYERKIKKK